MFMEATQAQFLFVLGFLSTAMSVHYYRPRSEGDNRFGSVRPSVRLSACALTAEMYE